MDSNWEMFEKVEAQFSVVSVYQFTVFLDNGTLVFLFCIMLDSESILKLTGFLWENLLNIFLPFSLQ